MKGSVLMAGAQFYKLVNDDRFGTVQADEFLGPLRAPGTQNTLTLQAYQAIVTVANGATTGKESAIGMPANFIPMCVAVHVLVAATNAVNLVDIGDDADTDSYTDGIAVAVNSTGFKGVFGCNGVRGITGLTGATTTPDEVEVVVSADPGATGVTVRLTFMGIVAA
jgi:hypothetical protein